MPDGTSPEQARQFALWVVQELRRAGYEALWAGGCVRDQLLQIEPSDYDVATQATPDEVRQVFGRSRTLAIGAAFGVITVRGRRGQGQIEVATFRCDAAYSDGRHPDQVTFSDAREDALRRDFTMNGLFYDPLADRIIDYVGGQEDLRRGVVRAIGDPYARIAEDKLRMLRAVRFAATFGFQLDPSTAAAVRREASHISVVSAERIAGELRKMLVHRNRAQAVAMLRDLQLLRVILPESAILDHPAVTAGSWGTWDTTLGLLERLTAPTFRMALAALLGGMITSDSGHGLLGVIGERWKLSKYEQKGLVWLLSKQTLAREALTVPWPRLQPLLIDPAVNELLELAEAVAQQLQEPLDGIAYCRSKLQLPPAILDPPPLITGDDLQQAGYQAGPHFRQLLEAVRDAQLEGQVKTAEDALALVSVMAKRLEADE